MANNYSVKDYTRVSALKLLAQRTDARLDALELASGSGFKSLKVTGHTVTFYTTTDQTGNAAATLDFPTEMFLDQAKTKFVDNFAWSEAAYPGSANPSHDDINLEGKPVMVLAVRGDADGDGNADNDTVSYSFLDMSRLVDTYKAKTEGKDASTTITISGYEVEVMVNLSAKAGNRLSKENDGLYVGPETVTGDENNFVGIAADGTLKDSGKSASSFSKVAPAMDVEDSSKLANDGTLMIDGGRVQIFNVATDEQIEAMLDEVFGSSAE